LLLYVSWAGDVAQHRQRDFMNQPQVVGRHGEKPWHEYRPAIGAAAEPVRLSHPLHPGTLPAATAFLSASNAFLALYSSWKIPCRPCPECGSPCLQCFKPVRISCYRTHDSRMDGTFKSQCP